MHVLDKKHSLKSMINMVTCFTFVESWIEIESEVIWHAQDKFDCLDLWLLLLLHYAEVKEAIHLHEYM